MPMYWEQSACGLLAKDSNMEVEDENCDIQKPKICSNEDEEHMEDPTVNTILIMELHMTNESVNNNNRNEGFGKQRSKDELSRLSTESIEVSA
jgi:hypothetical protein